MTEKITDITDFILQLDALKTVDRRSYINGGHRLENPAEHSLKPVDDPDEIHVLSPDPQQLPGGNYQQNGYEARQVMDVDISRFATEYRAKVWLGETGERFVAAFPEGVNAHVQYGIGVKASAVYQSLFVQCLVDSLHSS